MTLECPRCRRKVAVARTQCLYCGADLSGPGAPAARAPRAPAPARAPGDAPPSDRALVIVSLDGVDPGRLRAALELSSYEAGQWTRRGGYQLLRVAGPAEADAERARIAAAGVAAFTCAEADARAGADPMVVLGGGFDGAALRLRTPAGPLVLAAPDLLLVVKGAITREHPTRDNPRFTRIATLETGFRFHLHRRDPPRPVEIDPGEFDFGATRAGESSILEIAGWIAALTVPVDDGFRRVTPALAPVIRPPGSSSTLEDALRTGPKAPPAILDNLAQFRFYSAWRGAVERQARGG